MPLSFDVGGLFFGGNYKNLLFMLFMSPYFTMFDVVLLVIHLTLDLNNRSMFVELDNLPWLCVNSKLAYPHVFPHCQCLAFVSTFIQVDIIF